VLTAKHTDYLLWPSPSRFGSRYAPEIPAAADSELVAKRGGFVPFAKTNGRP